MCTSRGSRRDARRRVVVGPPPVMTQQRRKADAKVRVIAAIIIGVIVFGIVHLVDMPRMNPEDAVRQYLTYLADGDAESALGDADDDAIGPREALPDERRAVRVRLPYRRRIGGG